MEWRRGWKCQCHRRGEDSAGFCRVPRGTHDAAVDVAAVESAQKAAALSFNHDGRAVWIAGFRMTSVGRSWRVGALESGWMAHRVLRA